MKNMQSFSKAAKNLPRYSAVYLILLMALGSCNLPESNSFPAVELKLAKTIPNVFKRANDSLFKVQQDTVYYAEKYFTGCRYETFENGDTAALNCYFNGVEESIQKKWHPNSFLAEERFYINGKKEGVQKGWWPNGQPKFYYTALDNEYNGEFKEWYQSGLLAKQFHYSKGQEEGSQRLWWDNNAVRANYVIKNGKKYGLIGLKICVNPYDSIPK